MQVSIKLQGVANWGIKLELHDDWAKMLATVDVLDYSMGLIDLWILKAFIDFNWLYLWHWCKSLFAIYYEQLQYAWTFHNLF
jgi:hypothetical protein